MLIPLGILAASGGGAPLGPIAYELISTTVLGSDTGSVTFSNLGNFSSTYRHLQIRYSGKSAGSQEFRLVFNGVGSGYARHGFRGSASSVTSYGNANLGQILFDGGLADTASSWFGAGLIDILDAYSTNKNKTVRQYGGEVAGSNQVFMHSGFLNSTSAIGSITISSGANLTTNSRFSLYGIRG